MKSSQLPIVSLQCFIEATRDSGYKGTSAAIAELVDNAFEAKAKLVAIDLMESIAGEGKAVSVSVTDDGTGMSPTVLQLAMQFGGSTRFQSRTGLGRYGMGLPNGSLSQARRVDVVSWEAPGSVWTTYLDVDEIASGRIESVPAPRRVGGKQLQLNSTSGTIVRLTRCDRLDFKRVSKLETRLILDLGRLFRRFLLNGSAIRVNGKSVQPIDPLFLFKGQNSSGAHPFGPPLEYQVRVNGGSASGSETAVVRVLFSELPLDTWHLLSNEEKNRRGIAKGAGISIVRAGREIDYGWFFMGSKRRENYDDWWRCEVSFPPSLDDLFGVTHTKQKIRPTEQISALLTPDMEQIARELNGRVRRKYAEIRQEEMNVRSLQRLEDRDYLLEPPQAAGQPLLKLEPSSERYKQRAGALSGLKFSIVTNATTDRAFYVPTLTADRLLLTLNEAHPFYRKFYRVLAQKPTDDHARMLECLQILLVAAGRGESAVKGPHEREIIRVFRETWSDALVAFLS
jgi:hypothetical protein